MAKRIPAAVKTWWRKWSHRLMHPDDMSRAQRTNLYEEVVEIVSIRERTIAALIDADPNSAHYDGLIADAKELIGVE